MSGDVLPGIKAVNVLVTGRVQGVGFRYSARQEAVRKGLKGWVRNQADGSVGLHCEGPESVVDSFVTWLKTGPPGSRVLNVTVKSVNPEKKHTTFAIVP